MFCDNSPTFEDMLEKSGQLRIRLNLIRLFIIDMFKCVNDLNPLYTNEMFIGKGLIIFETKADYCNLNSIYQKIWLPVFQIFRFQSLE